MNCVLKANRKRAQVNSMWVSHLCCSGRSFWEETCCQRARSDLFINPVLVRKRARNEPGLPKRALTLTSPPHGGSLRRTGWRNEGSAGCGPAGRSSSQSVVFLAAPLSFYRALSCLVSADWWSLWACFPSWMWNN